MISNHAKKLALLLATLTPFSTLLPISSCFANTTFDGLYIGAGGGLSLTTSSLNSNSRLAISTDAPGTFTANASTKHYFKKGAGVGALFAGLGYSCDPLYFGGELFFKIGNANATFASNAADSEFVAGGASPTSSITDSSSLRFQKVEYAADFRPGILLSDCNLLYGRIGIARNKFSLTSNINATFNDTVVLGVSTITYPNSKTASKSITALRLGAGMEQMFCQCLSLRLDYTYTRYRRIVANSATSFSYTDPGTGSIVQTNLSNTIKLKPDNHTFMLGLSYYW